MKQPELHYYDLGTPLVTAFSSTRHGGCSRGAYGEFNINAYCGDDIKAIRQNREALCRLLHIDSDHLIMPHQTHQTRVATIDERFLSRSATERQMALEGIDAVMTNVRGVCIGVSTADCIPILIYDPQQQAVCAVHAGWRGTVCRIIERAVSAMSNSYGSHPTDLLAVVGPGISRDSFEVGQEVYDAFEAAGFAMDAISLRRDKWHIDLPACNRLQLLAAGLDADNIRLSGICTYQQCDDYFSARRLSIHSGRIFNGILLRQ